jgi:hypothetical protein
VASSLHGASGMLALVAVLSLAAAPSDAPLVAAPPEAVHLDARAAAEQRSVGHPALELGAGVAGGLIGSFAMSSAFCALEAAAHPSDVWCLGSLFLGFAVGEALGAAAGIGLAGLTSPQRGSIWKSLIATSLGSLISVVALIATQSAWVAPAILIVPAVAGTIVYEFDLVSTGERTD